MPYRLLLSLLAVTALSASALSASTIDTTWGGPAGGSWTTVGNWNNGVPLNSPSGNFNAIFADAASSTTTLLSIDATISGLSLGTNHTISISSGKTLTLDSGTFTSTGSFQGNVAILGAGNATFTGGAGILGQLTNSSTGQATFDNTQMGNLSNAAGGVINVKNSISMAGGTISNDGSVIVTGTLGRSGNLAVNGIGTLSLVGGTITGSGGGLTNSSTIDGYGTIGLTTNNSGTISSSGSGKTLTLSVPLTNSGIVEAKNGSTLNLAFVTNTGTLRTDLGGTMTIVGGTSGGDLIADGGTVNLQNTHFTQSYNGNIIAQNSGLIVSDTQMFGTTVVHSTGTLDEGALVSDVTVDAGGTLKVRGGTLTKLSNSGSVTSTASFATSALTNNAGGIITMTGGTLTPQGTTVNNGLIQMVGGIYQNQTSAITGTGKLTLAGTTVNFDNFTNGAGHTIEGSGTISVFVNNNGNLVAKGGNLDVAVGASKFVNNGLVKADTGSVFIEPAGSNRFTNFDTGVLTGGTFEAHGTNNIEFVGADITTNDSNIILVDGGHIRDFSDPTKDGLRNLKTNNGTFDLENTTFNAQTDDFFNNGHVIVGAGSVFNVDKGAKLVNQTGGVVSGTGIINGDVDNDKGTFAPGDDPGILNINGAYYQGLTGELDLEFATNTLWSELLVSGNAQINGELRLVIDSAFDAAIGSTFELFRSGSMTGSFAEFDSDIFNGKEFQLVRLNNGYDVEVVSVTSPEPATFGLGLLALAGCIIVGAKKSKSGRRCTRMDTDVHG